MHPIGGLAAGVAHGGATGTASHGGSPSRGLTACPSSYKALTGGYSRRALKGARPPKSLAHWPRLVLLSFWIADSRRNRVYHWHPSEELPCLHPLGCGRTASDAGRTGWAGRGGEGRTQEIQSQALLSSQALSPQQPAPGFEMTGCWRRSFKDFPTNTPCGSHEI